MTVAFISDVHIGNYGKDGGGLTQGINERALQVFKSLNRAVEEAEDCEALVILGDLFHYSSPEPALIAMTQKILSQHPRVIALVGNHDQVSDERSNNALSPLAPVAQIVETPTTVLCMGTHGVELVLIPFRTGKSVDWLDEALTSLGTSLFSKRALCMHLGISDSATPYYLDGGFGNIVAGDLAKICKRHKISDVFAGDWHRHQTWRRGGIRMMQVGALCPNRYPPNYEHGDRGPMAFWDGGKPTIKDIPGPRFRKVTWKDLDKNPSQVPTENYEYLKIHHKARETDEVREWMANHEDQFCGLTTDVDRAAERAQARTASFEARQAGSLDASLQVFIKKMPVGKGCSRENILKKSREFVGRADR